ncbi:MAG: hypothetical protein JJE29_08530 [Peptostreptococcaceae bacterium]|nr:hypothetical protein [Peptostreptococcaceae bacterium]
MENNTVNAIENRSETQASGERNDFLKVLACIFMLIDHVGYMFFPQFIILRVVGRLAFPIFAYGVAMGYRKTSNLGRYMKRLAVFSLIAQVPYIWFSPGNLNIMPTLLVGLWVVWLHENGGRYGFVLAGLLVVTGDILHLQYGSYGLMMIWIFYIYSERKGILALAYAAMSIFFAWAYGWPFSMVMQLFSIGALPFIFADWKVKLRVNRYFFYAFYPGHIIILLLIRMLISGK